MNLTIRKSTDRGHADYGWLNTRYSFSFADYHDPRHMEFRSLRVINQDIVAGGGGFPTHPHRDMEIFSYVLSGAMQHQDSLGNGRILTPGQIQLMSAGTGVTHSEFNPSETEPLHLLQIWIHPRQRNLPPSYTEWHPDAAQADAPKVLVISADGRENSAIIHQDASIYRIRLTAGQTLEHPLEAGRGAWLQVITGELTLNSTALHAGDAAATEDAGTLTLTATADIEALLFDLA